MNVNSPPASPSGKVSPAESPKVSIVLPIYNRAAFLEQALRSMQSQSYSDWELVVVDDGSTDQSREILEELKKGIPQPVHYHYQPNSGAYAARNAGVENAQGDLIAFFDSDDRWLPHHLADCVAALDANSEVDWVYGAGKIVELGSGATLASNTFYVEDKPRPFLTLPHRTSGRLRILEGPKAIRCQMRHGLYCGLQKSVMRRSVFHRNRFKEEARDASGKIVTSAEDQLFVMRFLAEGRKLGYFDQVHLVYHVHESNSSAAASESRSIDQKARIILALIEGYEEVPSYLPLDRKTRRALKHRLGREYFWTLGYSVLWQNGRRREALEAFRRGLKCWPWDLTCWKTYFTAQLRSLISLNSSASSAKAPNSHA